MRRQVCTPNVHIVDSKDSMIGSVCILKSGQSEKSRVGEELEQAFLVSMSEELFCKEAL